MTSRERLIAAIHHQAPDRCPIDLGATGQTGMNASTMYKLRKALGLPEKPIRIIEPAQMLGMPDEDLLRAVGCDVIGLWNRSNFLGYKNENWKPWKMPDGTPVEMGGDFQYDVDAAGNTFVYPQGDRQVPPSAMLPAGGSFFDGIDHCAPYDFDELDEDQLDARADFQDDFALASDEDARYWERESRRLFDETQYGIVGLLGGAGLGDVAALPGPFLKHPTGIRRMADWLEAHLLFPDYVDEVFSYQTEVMLKNLEIYREAVGERIQVIWISGTDFGTQHATFLSPQVFRKLYKPHYQKINDWVHQNTGWKTFYHSCGAVYPLMADFVQMGVDILNPLQLSADGMDAGKIKQEFGQELTFWGGGVDTQQTLPFGTPEAVAKEVEARLACLSRGGGYVFNPIHNVVSNVPPENLIAMYRCALG
ncbi:MAG: uroporphyrinogen decarboxylase family protein [Clostridia bacterium]